MSDKVYQLPAVSAADDNDMFEVYQRTDGTRRQFDLIEAATQYNWELQKVVTITSAQLLALNATEQTIVAAPGANLMLVPTMWAARKAAGTAYAGIAAGEDLALKYTDSSGNKAALDIETTGFLDQTTAELRVAPGVGGLTAAVEPAANAALVCHLLSGEITTGDTDLEVLVRYRIVSTNFSGT